MTIEQPKDKAVTGKTARPTIQLRIDKMLCDLLDATKPDHYNRELWANTLLDIAIRIKLFSDSPETAFKQQQFVEFPRSIGELTGNSTVYISNKKLEENNATINNYNYYCDSSNIEGSYTADQKQKKEADKTTLEDVAESVLEQLRLEEVNRPLNAKAKQIAEDIKELDQKLHKDSFEAFWKLYQSCPSDLRATGQSKKQTREEYKLAIKKTSPERLLEAAEKAVTHQMEATRRHEWAAPLPNAYRWLRDEKWAVWLDQIEERQQRKGDWA